jgi:hypothetical protein
MANHSLPSVSSTYTNYTTELNDRINDVCKGLDTAGTYTSLPTNSIGWSSTGLKWQKWNGSAWADLSTSYSININGTVGAGTPNAVTCTTLTVDGPAAASGAGLTALFASPPNIGSTTACPSATIATLTVNTDCTLPNSARRATAGDILVGTTATQTLTNKTLTAPVISTITNNTFTLTLPSAAADTLVGRATTDTLTNKTLTSPKIGTAILDTAGANLIALTATASAANYLTINNAITSGTVAIAGTGTNCTVNITSTGTGTVKANGVQVADLSSTQSLTNKTISGTFTGSITGDVTGNVTGNCSGSAGSATTATTATTANALNTANNYQVNSLGVNTAGSGTAGEIRATNNITAYYSSDRDLKTNIVEVESALSKVVSIGCKEFDWTDEYINDHGGCDDYFLQRHDYGVIAQDVLSVFPIAVRTREDGTLAVDYQKLAVLAFGAIKELTARIEILEKK